MKRILIQSDGRLCDIVSPGQEFPVASGLTWADAPDDVSPDTHEWDGAAVVVKPAPPPRFATVAAALAGLKADCDALAAAKRDAVTRGISPAEMASWPIKRDEALAYQASGNAADAPMLGIEAAARAVTLGDLAAKALSKAALLSQMEAQIAGVNGLHNDALDALAADAASTVDTLLSYDITMAWPI